MVEGKKFIVGLFIGILFLVGGVYTVNILDTKIVVSLPSDVCNSATLRVTKDDFTLKCGRYIAFQADTITEYYKTYGTDEWVRNNRFVGLNKKHITLELTDYGDYFDIIRKTRYRKGRQNIDDGVLYETYTFTKDKVKISYNYEVNNKALHRISMRIKKEVGSYLDASDPFGHTGVRAGNILYYEGYGNLIIDPSITLVSPLNRTNISYSEGASVSFVCTCNESSNLSDTTSMSFWWNAENESYWHANETTAISSQEVNISTTYTKTIPHPVTSTFPGTFYWSCECCSGTNVSGVNCTFAPDNGNFTLDARYKPEVPTISSPNTTHLNLLNGSLVSWNPIISGTNRTTFLDGYFHINDTRNQTIYINWTHPGLRDNSTGIIWNLSYYGTSNSTRQYDTNFEYNTINTTIFALFNTSALPPDLYYVTLRACNEFNVTLCSNGTLDIPIDIFDYGVNISTGESKIRFSPMPTYTLRPALGQTPSQGIISVDWLGNRAPDGQINLSINHTEADTCMDIYAYHNNSPASAVHLLNNTYVSVLLTTDADPDYIWLWATKSYCFTTTTSFQLDLDLFFGGT